MVKRLANSAHLITHGEAWETNGISCKKTRLCHFLLGDVPERLGRRTKVSTLVFSEDAPELNSGWHFYLILVECGYSFKRLIPLSYFADTINPNRSKTDNRLGLHLFRCFHQWSKTTFFPFTMHICPFLGCFIIFPDKS